MPGPPPPPPPGGILPPPPMPASMSKASGGSNDRSDLLKSIQKGAKLKKTVTNDKSAPLISGRVSNNTSSNNNNHNSNSNNSAKSPGHQQLNGGGNGLGGLFAGGMPKLRSTGILSGVGTQSNGSSSTKNTSYHQQNNGVASNNKKPMELPQQPPTKSNNLQSELRKQMANDNRNRGPPPPAPVRYAPEEINVKPSYPTSPSSVTDSPSSINGIRPNQSSLHSALSQNPSTLHRKAKSQASLNIDYRNENNRSTPSSTSPVNGVVKPAIHHRKPNLAPKPPVLNGKPVAPPKRLILPKGVNRAQSMKSPRLPSPQQSPDTANTPDGAGSQIKFGTVRNMSSMLAQSLSGSTSALMGGGGGSPRLRPTINGRPTAPPPSIPQLQQQQSTPPPQNSAPLPPSKTSVQGGWVKPPNHAPPPPPPSHTPPPPPHKTLPTRAPPAVPNMNAPPPPPRHSSMTSSRKVALEFEDKFKFQPVHTFPKPQPYKNVYKYYGNRQAGNKQQAPQPPNVQNTATAINRHQQWDSTSAC